LTVKKNKNRLVYLTNLIDFIKSYEDDNSAPARYAVNCKDENQKWLSFFTFIKSVGKDNTNNQSNPNKTFFSEVLSYYFFYDQKSM